MTSTKVTERRDDLYSHRDMICLHYGLRQTIAELAFVTLLEQARGSDEKQKEEMVGWWQNVDGETPRTSPRT